MKMEIPVASPAAGKLKSILVSIDDVVAEGQVLAIIEIVSADDTDLAFVRSGSATICPQRRTATTLGEKPADVAIAIRR